VQARFASRKCHSRYFVGHSAEDDSGNKLESKELADDVFDTVQQILQVFPALPDSPTPGPSHLYDEGIGQFRRYIFILMVVRLNSTLESVATVVERINQQSRLRRFFTQQDDKEELLKCEERILKAKVQFIVGGPPRTYSYMLSPSSSQWS
jgi:hypothetical protein